MGRFRLHRPVIWLWALFTFGIIYTAGVFYRESLRALPPVPSMLRASAPVTPIQLTPVVIDGDERVNLTGESARFIALQRGENPQLALDALLGAQWQAIGNLNPLPKQIESEDRNAVYVLFAYRTTTPDPIFLRYRSISPLLATVWVSEPGGEAFRLVDVAGADAPAYRPPQGAAVATPLRILPHITLPQASNEMRIVLVRMDSVFPVWSSFTLYARYTFAHVTAQLMHVYGAFLGAVVAVMAFALYGLFKRQVLDYAVFLLAAAVMTGWFLVSQELSLALNLPWLRRVALSGPVYLYFLLHCFGVWRLLYPTRRVVHRHRQSLRLLPLVMASSISFIGLVHSAAYGVLGIEVPWPTALHSLNEMAFVIIPPFLILAVAAAPNRRLPGYLSLLIGESIGSVGLLLQWLRFNSAWLDPPLISAIVQYALPLEVLIWSYVLAVRYNYLEMVAKGRVRAALRRETKRATESMATVVQSREAALASLNQSYQSAVSLQKEVASIVSTFRHSAKNLLVRLGFHLSGHPKAESCASKVAEHTLDELALVIEGFSQAIGAAQDEARASASARHLLQWQIEARRAELARRRVDIFLLDRLAGEDVQVDGYHFMEAVREALSNLSRYASSDSQVTILLAADSAGVMLELRNRAVLRSDDWNLRHGWPVTPATVTENGETSHGVGLSALRTLLTQIGGTVRCECELPNTFVLTIRMPQRNLATA